MIRSLRRRFVFGAVLSLSILIALLIGGISLVSYIQMEQRSDELMRLLLDERATPPAPEPERRPQFAFGYSLPDQPMPIGYCIARFDARGQSLGLELSRLPEPDVEVLKTYADEILFAGKERGKLGAYKYQLKREETGETRIAFLDNSIQVEMLRGTLRAGLALGAGAILLMLVILLPVSKRLTRGYAAHIEKQKQFITNASHEIKTPIAIIQSNIDAMELIQGANKWSRNIRGQTVRLNALLKQLIFMARMDEIPLSPDKRPIALSEMLVEDASAYEEALRDGGCAFQTDIEPKLTLPGSRENLKQLFSILMDNAVQYTNPGGEISLSLHRRGRHARIAVRNTVDRLPDCPPQTLFDRFYRGDSARTQKASGCGIGLSAALAIAQMHRGRIEAQYMANNAIQFVVDLPL